MSGAHKRYDQCVQCGKKMMPTGRLGQGMQSYCALCNAKYMDQAVYIRAKYGAACHFAALDAWQSRQDDNFPDYYNGGLVVE
jgi:hypothetical protein